MAARAVSPSCFPLFHALFLTFYLQPVGVLHRCCEREYSEYTPTSLTTTSMDEPALASLPVPFERLAALLESAGRLAVLEALKDAGVTSLPLRQKFATLVARTQRQAPGERPAIREQRQPNKQPLCVRAEAGLCNKLRTILSYAEVARARKAAI